MPSTKLRATKSRSPEVDAYLAKLPEARRESLEKLRELIHKTAPGLPESIEYGMPAFGQGEIGCAFAAQKHYLSFYVCRLDILQKHAKALEHLNRGKCCVRFKTFDDLPVATIRAIIQEAAKPPK